MEQLKISLAEVQNASLNLRGCNQQIYDFLSHAKSEMDKLAAFWQSESSETARQRFQQFSTQFEAQREIIEAYARFLDHTVETYDALETAINSNASSF